MGKAVFCNIFFQHASFITGSRMPGELLFSTADKIEQNFLSFLRLIGTLYFKKHFSAMVSLRGTETLLNSQKTSMDHTKQHECLYDWMFVWRHTIYCEWSNYMWGGSNAFTHLYVATLAAFLLGCIKVHTYKTPLLFSQHQNGVDGIS